MTATQKTTIEKTTTTTPAYDGFTDEERGAMKERAKELKASARAGSRAAKAAEEEAAVLAKIAEMQDSDRAMAERVHEIVRANAPALAPKLWYGMPSYARDGKVVCFFQSAEKFKARYATLGFSDQANLDEDAMWATSFALKNLTPADETRIAALVRTAAH
ncbi:iron chaperone [Streptomyces sp. NPDC054961]